MPMIPTTMAGDLKLSLMGCQGGGIHTMWSTICNYVELNAQVLYSWVAFSASTPPTPDPMVVITASIDTSLGRVLSLPGIEAANKPEVALSIISAGMNLAAASWMISFPLGFMVSPCFVIPTISLTQSMQTNQDLALNFLCTQIIMGIKAATPGMAGSHSGIYTGTGIFTSIL